MRKSFTMIELIFVIVILGILAAVAIPKFGATRDDAIISSRMDSVSVAMNEIAGYSIATGKVENDLSLMSNALTKLKNLNLATMGIKSADIQVGVITDCVTISVLTSGTDENISIVLGAPGTDIVCLGFQNKMQNSIFSLPIRGQVASF